MKINNDTMTKSLPLKHDVEIQHSYVTVAGMLLFLVCMLLSGVLNVWLAVPCIEYFYFELAYIS